MPGGKRQPHDPHAHHAVAPSAPGTGAFVGKYCVNMPRHNAFTRSKYRQFSCRRNHRHRDSQRYSSWRILPGNSSSDGSSIEAALHELRDQKVEQTVEFFSHIYGKAPNADAIRLLMGSQLWYFRQLLDRHMEEGRMLTCLQAVLDFTNAGWRQLCDTLQ